MCEPAYNENNLNFDLFFLQKLDTVKEAHLSYSSYVCWRSVCATRAKRYLSVQVSINVSIPKVFQINCSIDLCYIKTAISETLPLYSNYVTFKELQFKSQTQQATKLETVEPQT